MLFRKFLEAAEADQSRYQHAEANLERALADPRVSQTLANLAMRAASGDERADAQLVASVEKLLGGGSVLEASDAGKRKLAEKIAANLKRYSQGLAVAAKSGRAVGQNLLQLKVIQITKAAFNEFMIDFMTNFSADKGATATALGTVAGMAGKRVKAAWAKFWKKTPKASADQFPPS